MNYECVVLKVKNCGGSVMMWQFFGEERAGDSILLKGIMEKGPIEREVALGSVPKRFRSYQ